MAGWMGDPDPIHGHCLRFALACLVVLRAGALGSKSWQTSPWLKNLASLPTGCPHSWQKLNYSLANQHGHPELLARSRYPCTVAAARHSGWWRGNVARNV